MYEVLMYLFQHYRTPQSFPETDDLHAKLTTVGFDEESVDLALDWLIGLASATQNIRLVSHANPGTVRIYAPQELDQLGVEAIRLIKSVSTGALLHARSSRLPSILGV